MLFLLIIASALASSHHGDSREERFRAFWNHLPIPVTRAYASRLFDDNVVGVTSSGLDEDEYPTNDGLDNVVTGMNRWFPAGSDHDLAVEEAITDEDRIVFRCNFRANGQKVDVDILAFTTWVGDEITHIQWFGDITRVQARLSGKDKEL